MKIINKFKLALLTLIIVSCSSEEKEQPDVNIILTNGRVYTMQWDEPEVDGTLSDEAPNEEGW